MKSFAYANPQTVEQAVGLLSDTWGETEVLAGGTDLVTSLKQGLTTPEVVVSLKNLNDLRGISVQGDTLHIGAMATLKSVVTNATVQEHFPAFVTAAKNIGSDQMTNAGTIGGELLQRPRCWYFRQGLGLFAMHNGESLVVNGDNRYHAIFATDSPPYFVNASSFAPILNALDATVTLQGPNGEREVKVAEFYKKPENEADREYALRPNEVLTRISIPIQGKRNGLYEVRQRIGLDWPMVAAAVAFDYSGGDRQRSSSNARVVLGHVAVTPWYSEAASKALEGQTLQSVRLAYFGTHEEVLDAAGDAAVEGARPLSRNGYKVHQAKIAVKRAIESALPDRHDAWGVERENPIDA